jgi:hypothetical protein
MRYLVAVLCLTGLAFAVEPIKFRGAYIGEPLSDFVDCFSHKPRALKDGAHVHGKVCEGKRGAVYSTKTSGLMSPKFEGESFNFEDQKLIEIVMYVAHESEWEKVRYDLTQKMGEPRSEVPEIYQNLLGARWEANQGLWVKDDIVAAAGIKVAKLFGAPMQDPLTKAPETEGIQIKIVSAERAKLPETRPSTLD